MGAAVDNDVLYKGARFDLLAEIIAAIPVQMTETLVLGHARFVVGKYLARDRDRGRAGAEAALARFLGLLDALKQIEPTREEQAFAAELEHKAQDLGLALHAGESLLCAVVVMRDLARFATGDKRCIEALQTLTSQESSLHPLAGRVVCLEQLFVGVLGTVDPQHVKECVCRDPTVDKALSICLSCASGGGSVEQWLDGLRSYIAYVRGRADAILVP